MYQLEQQYSKCPYVNFSSMIRLPDHFRCHILGCSTVGVSLPFIHVTLRISLDIGFANPPKVTDFDQVLLTNEEIFRLQVSVDESVFVQKIDALDCLNEKPESVLL